VKKPWLAFLLNFILPGAGFAYLGKWAWAAINLGAAIAAGFVIAAYLPNSANIAGVVVAATSGSLAMSVAQAMNTKANT
jgi:hypothetical protein